MSMLLQARNTQSHQSLEKAEKDSILELWEGAWSCQHFDFRFLASRIVREYVFVRE